MFRAATFGSVWKASVVKAEKHNFVFFCFFLHSNYFCANYRSLCDKIKLKLRKSTLEVESNCAGLFPNRKASCSRPRKLAGGLLYATGLLCEVILCETREGCGPARNISPVHGMIFLHITRQGCAEIAFLKHFVILSSYPIRQIV